MHRRFRALVGLLAAELFLTTAAPAGLAAVGCPRTTELAMESRFMCQVCGLPLPLANSLEADRERAYIARLVDDCETPGRIEAAMVAQYGQSILATPPAHGFGVAAWVVPILVISTSGIAIGLAIALARRRTRVRHARRNTRPVSAEEAELLDATLAAFDSRD